MALNEMSRSGEIRWLAGVPGVGTMYLSPDTIVLSGLPGCRRFPFFLREIPHRTAGAVSGGGLRVRERLAREEGGLAM